VTPPETTLTMGLVDFDRGFKWLIEPREAAAPAPADAKPREPDAPTLRRKPSN
jgi:hypothetical protein